MLSDQGALFEPVDDRKAWQRSYPANLYSGGPPEEPKDRAGTSHQAARRIEPHANTMRSLVKRFITGESDGATDDEIEVRLGLRHQSASARRRELVLLGEIRDSGKRRQTRSGRAAVVWVANG